MGAYANQALEEELNHRNHDGCPVPSLEKSCLVRMCNSMHTFPIAQRILARRIAGIPCAETWFDSPSEIGPPLLRSRHPPIGGLKRKPSPAAGRNVLGRR